MKFYRVKQFIWAVGSTFKKVDYGYIKKYLNDDEILMFNKLKKSDKHHCIRVCSDSVKLLKENNFKIDENKVGKAALLHDIGKSQYHLNVIEKSTVVLLDKFSNGNLKKYNNIKQIDIYYNHPKIGYDMLKKYNYDKELLEVVRYHHKNKEVKNNKLVDIISISDNKN